MAIITEVKGKKSYISEIVLPIDNVKCGAKFFLKSVTGHFGKAYLISS